MEFLPSGTDTAKYMRENQNERLIGSSVALIVLSTTFVLLRLASRRVSKAGFWWDDAVIVVALLLSYALPVANIAGIRYKNGKHIYTLSPSDLKKWLKTFYVFELSYIVSVSVVKFSILLFYQRIFPIPQFKKPLIITHLVVLVFMVSIFFAYMFQCTPLRFFWLGPTINEPSPIKGKCVDIDKLLLSTGSINVLLDFVILALPIPVLWRLRTTKLQMTLLTGIFGVATFVCVVSFIRLIVLSRVSQKDKTWTYVNAAIWTATEVSMGVVSACIPSLRPLITLIFHRGSYPSSSANTKLSNTLTSSTISASTVYPHSHSKHRGKNNSSNDNNNDMLGSRANLKEQGGDFMRFNSETGIGGEVAAWGHEVVVHAASKADREMDGDMEMEDIEAGEIRVRTEITLTRERRIDYLDKLY